MREFIGLVLFAIGALICAWMIVWLFIAVFMTTQGGRGWLPFVPTALLGFAIGALFAFVGRRVSSA